MDVSKNNRSHKWDRNKLRFMGIISHGRAAEILGIFKMDLIMLYGKLGIPYIQMTDDEIEEELETVKELGEMLV